MILVNLPGWCWAEIQQFALVGSSSSLHSEACNALGASDGVIHSRISLEVPRLRAGTNICKYLAFPGSCVCVPRSQCLCLCASLLLSCCLGSCGLLWCSLVLQGLLFWLGRACLALAKHGFCGIFAVTQFSRNGLFLGPGPSSFLRPVTAAVWVRTRHTFSAFWL